MEEVGGNIEAILASYPPLHKEACHRMKGWYKAVSNHAPFTDQLTLGWITAERVALYCQLPPPIENIPIYIDPFQVWDLVAIEENIEWVVRRLRTNLYGDSFGIRVEHLWGGVGSLRSQRWCCLQKLVFLHD